jgi:glutathione synthase/RimK-type ligase-like ATP-grasp enzyme
MKKNIFLFLDYRDQFYFSTRYRGACVDVEKLRNYFKDLGFDLIIKRFYELDFRKESYSGEWVLYQSSEDPNLHYKDYIEDMLLGLRLQHAKLIPDFKYFRAHHNKVFMEVLRDISDIEEIKDIKAYSFGTYEEYSRSAHRDSVTAQVMKPGSGTRSQGVSLLKTTLERTVYPFKISRSFTLNNVKLLFSKIRTGKSYTPMSNNRRKFIVQNFIDGLKGDYRILAYGKKFYVVYRKNRDNHFTASGSGKLDFEVILPDGLLDYAEAVYRKFAVPYMSLDIGHKDGKFYLFEFQCLCLGQYTLEKSKFYYKKLDKGLWEKVRETPDLEREISTTVSAYIDGTLCAE